MNPRLSLTIGRIAGIPVRIHISWLLAAIYLTALFAGQFAGMARAADVADARLLLPPWAWGSLLMLGLFACVLLHEFGHVLVARRGGVEVRSVTLMMLGGVSEIGDVERPRLELVMAAAGPLVSLALALAFFLGFRTVGRATPDLRFGLYYLAQINLVLGVFNLLPAFPMDGGRVLRSALTRSLGIVRATKIAAAVGKVFGVFMLLVGIAGGNLWMLLIGGFLLVGGDAESRATEMKVGLRGVHVGDLFVRRLATVGSEATLREAAQALLRERADACIVSDGVGAPVGLLTTGMVAAVPVRRRAETMVASVMAAPSSLDVGDELAGALRTLGELRLDAIPVCEGNRFVGTLSREDVARGLQLSANGAAPSEAPVPR